VRVQAMLSLRLTFLIGLPCAVGMSMLSEPIVRLLYPSYPAGQIAIAGGLLSIGAFTIPLFILVQATTGVLQGLGYQKIPMYTLLGGAALKTALNYLLIGNPDVNIYGAPVASLCCYGLSAAINLGYALKRSGTRFDWDKVLLRPLAATLAMGLGVWAFTRFIGADGRVRTLLAVVAGMAVYAAAAPLVGAVGKADLELMPGAGRLRGLVGRRVKG